MALNAQLMFFKIEPYGTPGAVATIELGNAVTSDDHLYFNLPVNFGACSILGMVFDQPSTSSGVGAAGSQGTAIDIWQAKDRLYNSMSGFKETSGAIRETYEPMQLTTMLADNWANLQSVVERSPSVWSDFARFSPGYIGGTTYQIRLNRVWATQWAGVADTGTIIVMITTQI